MDVFHGVVGPPELDAVPGASFRIVQRRIQIAAQNGFRALDLSQLDGTLLALDWVVGETHHIWGSAVLVAPGVALTARHVVDDMRANGLLGDVGGYLLALGFHDDGMAIWNPRSFTSIGDGDLAILTLVRTTASPTAVTRHPVSINVAVMAARQPVAGECLSLVGFAATEGRYDTLRADRGAGLSSFGSVGPVIDVYSGGRDRSLPNPSVGVAARTVGGMSGGGAFDAEGRLIGVITSGIGEEPSFVSLCWPCVFTPLLVTWPPGLVEGEVTLHEMAQRQLCRIEGVEALRSYEVY
jgi:hypothetical protein